VEHAYSAQKLQLPFVSFPPVYRYDVLIEPLLSFLSTRQDYQNKKPDRFIVPLFNSHQILSYDLAKFAPPRRRKIKRGENWGKVAMLVKGFAKRVI
jgi:hypothetical protein